MSDPAPRPGLLRSAKHLASVLADLGRDAREIFFGRDIEATTRRLEKEVAELEAERERRKGVAKRLRSAKRLHNQVAEAKDHEKRADQARAELKRRERA